MDLALRMEGEIHEYTIRGWNCRDTYFRGTETGNHFETTVLGSAKFALMVGACVAMSVYDSDFVDGSFDQSKDEDVKKVTDYIEDELGELEEFLNSDIEALKDRVSNLESDPGNGTCLIYYIADEDGKFIFSDYDESDFDEEEDDWDDDDWDDEDSDN